MFQELLTFSEEVQEAMQQHKPIVTIESSMFSYYMSSPKNLAIIKLIEDIIRWHDVIPATIALYQGKIHIGIDNEIISHLINNEKIIQASRRDIAFVLSNKLIATTTVAAAMYCTYLAELPILITDGIGGIHNGMQPAFNMTADLIELASTPVTVICAGAKSILNLPKILEILETHGAPVIGYRTNEFPAFYSHSSGIPVLHRLNEITDIARLMLYQRKLKLNNGIVIANPIPKLIEIPEEKFIAIMNQAQIEANKMPSKLLGKAITPFILQRISELTADQNKESNIELIKNNADLGARIAIAHHNQKY